MAKPPATRQRSKQPTVNTHVSGFKTRANPPVLANGFAISILNDDVVVLSFADVEEEYENVFSSVALSKKTSVQFLRNLAKALDLEISDEQES